MFGKRKILWMLPCLAILAWAAVPRGAQGANFDARRVGMGGVFLCYHGCATQYNPAYLALPEHQTPFIVPVPLGLVQLAADFPALDPDDPDFDPFYLMNLMINPPFHLQLMRPDPPLEEAVVEINVSEDYLQVDLGDLQTYIPTAPVDPGIFHLRSPRLGVGIGDWEFTVAPLLIGRGSVSLSDNLIGALSEGEPFEADSEYDVVSEGYGAVMASINASHGRKLPFNLFGEDNPSYFGFTAKYIMGWGYADVQTRFAIETLDPVFSTDAPPDVEFEAIVRSSHPEWGTYGPSGHGFGLDFGVLTQFDKLEVGVGVQDLYSRVWWEAEVERWRLNQDTNEIKKKTLVPYERYMQKLPRIFMISFAYRGPRMGRDNSRHDSYTIATNMGMKGDEFSMSVGGEMYASSFPIRVGMFNESGKPQVSFGGGIPLGFMSVDLGFATHNRTLSGKKGMYMATSLRFGAF